jgi:ABC-type antimicrobial peptide transport system permease subunit
MFSYASKRIIRSRGLSLALFLSIILAATLFSGILQGADGVGGSILNNALKSTRYDIITTNVDEKNVTRINIYGIDEYFKTLAGVDIVDHFIRQDIELNSTIINGTVLTKIIALSSDSGLVSGIDAPGGLEDGKVYMDLGSMNATKFKLGEEISLGLLTYTPMGNIANFQRKYFNVEVGQSITLDDETWSIFMANSDGKTYYSSWVSVALGGSNSLGGRPQYNLVVVTENTYRKILEELYFNPVRFERRAPTIIHCVAAIRLDRGSFLNQWDISGSVERLQKIDEQINGMSGRYSCIPDNILEKVLVEVSSKSSGMKLNTLIITIPVFFTAWYLGMTVSDVAFGLRRREIGLLLTRGMSHRQVFMTLLFEALLLGIVSGILGSVIGAVILPFVISGAEFGLLFRYITPVTFAATMVFSLLLSTLAAYNPARKATQINVIEALREYREEEENLGCIVVPLMALLLGLYKLVFLILKLNIESFRPSSEDFISFLLYSTWYGMDSILGFIWTILLFWGFTKIFLTFSRQFQSVFGGLAARFVGDSARFLSLSSGRNLRRLGSFIFIVSLVMSYSVVVIGNSAVTKDYLDRLTRFNIGADASITIYNKSSVFEIANKVRGLDDVDSAAIEIAFLAKTSLGTMPIRAIEVEYWRDTAYTDELLISNSSYSLLGDKDSIVKDQYGVLQGGNALFERGAAPYFGLNEDGSGYVNIDVSRRVYTLKIVGLFGRDLGENWVPQNPTAYVPLTFVEKFQDEWINGIRILVKLKASADIQKFSSQVIAFGPNVQRVDVTSVVVDRAQNSALFAGSLEEARLGIIFAAAVASVGLVLIVYTMLRSRNTELNLMSIRGYSARQLSLSLIVETIGFAIFATVLGGVTGFINLFGQIELYNIYVVNYTSWRFIFPIISQLQLILLFLVVLVATVVPILLMVRMITEEPKLHGG